MVGMSKPHAGLNSCVRYDSRLSARIGTLRYDLRLESFHGQMVYLRVWGHEIQKDVIENTVIIWDIL